MTKMNKDTAAIWAEKLGDAYVGCYGLIDDLRRYNDGTEDEIENIYEASELISKAEALLEKIAGAATE